MKTFREEEHPRDNDGKFTSKGGNKSKANKEFLSNNTKSGSGEVVNVKPIENAYIRKTLQINNVKFNPVYKLKKSLTDNEIVVKVGQRDNTDGSCVSCALAYIGNKGGFDITDFRGDAGTRCIRSLGVAKQLVQLDGVKGKIVEESNDYVAANKLLADVQENKEYYLGIGKHASIIKKENGQLKYLELQYEKKDNGYKVLNKATLKRRFKCVQSNTLQGQKVKIPSVIIEVDSLAKSKDFLNILPYLNSKN